MPWKLWPLWLLLNDLSIEDRAKAALRDMAYCGPLPCEPCSWEKPEANATSPTLCCSFRFPLDPLTCWASGVPAPCLRACLRGPPRYSDFGVPPSPSTPLPLSSRGAHSGVRVLPPDLPASVLGLMSTRRGAERRLATAERLPPTSLNPVPATDVGVVPAEMLPLPPPAAGMREPRGLHPPSIKGGGVQGLAPPRGDAAAAAVGDAAGGVSGAGGIREPVRRAPSGDLRAAPPGRCCSSCSVMGGAAVVKPSPG